MSSYISYLTPASWTRAQKNKADLEATNPTNPVLNDEDERFLERITSAEGPAPPLPERKVQNLEPTVITESGEEKPASAEEQEEAAAKTKEVEEAEKSVVEKEDDKTDTPDLETQDVVDGMAVTSDKPSIEPTLVEDKPDLETQDVVEGMAVTSDKPSVESAATEESTPEGKTGTDGATDSKDEVKDAKDDVKEDAKDDTKDIVKDDLKDDDDAEKAKQDKAEDKTDDKEEKMTKSWASYLPSIPSIPTLGKKKDAAATAPDADKKEEEQKATDAAPTSEVQPESPKAKKAKKDHFPTQEEAEAATAAGVKQSEKAAADAAADPETSVPHGRTTEDVSNQSPRLWKSYIPSLSRGTPQEQAGASLASVVKQGKQASEKESPLKNPDGSQTDDEKEVSVLLDRLNLSAINNRVFSFSKDSQKVYENFTVVLKDIVNGGPTAYEDLEKLIKENEGQLDNMFGNMPPFVQTLVKSLPTKVMSSLGPEVLAAMSEKPGADMQAQMKAESSSSSAAASGSGLNIKSEDTTGTKKQKRGKIPTAKALVSEQGAVASMLKSILSFLKVRFPAFVTGTNVLMSLAVFSKSFASLCLMRFADLK